jgi:hypothetical protein
MIIFKPKSIGIKLTVPNSPTLQQIRKWIENRDKKGKEILQEQINNMGKKHA